MSDYSKIQVHVILEVPFTDLGAIQSDDGDDISGDAHQEEEDRNDLRCKCHCLHVTVPGVTEKPCGVEGALGAREAKVIEVRGRHDAHLLYW